jgi:hypothetical protein
LSWRTATATVSKLRAANLRCVSTSFGHFLDAVRTPGRPEVDYDHLAAQVGRRKRFARQGVELHLGRGPRDGEGRHGGDCRDREGGEQGCDQPDDDLGFHGDIFRAVCPVIALPP